MHTDASGTAPELSFPVKYQVFGSSDYNHDLRGTGALTIRTAGPSYLFSGRKRLVFFSGRKSTVEFGAQDICDVVASGRKIQFHTVQGTTAQPKKPFVFFCRNAEEATAVAVLLPDRKEADFAAAQDFSTKVSALPGAAHPWSSVTNLIIAANVVVFVVMAGFLGAGWLEVADIMPYVRYGANNGAATTDGEWWRLVTSMFMHFGILHLVFNMWALFQAGHFLEKLIGRRLYALAYAGSGVIGSLASILWHGDRMWSVGASGAIFGVYGALLGYMAREKRGMPRSVFQPMLKSTLVFAGYNLFYGLAHPGIDNAAHIGGFLSGIVIGWLVAVPIELEPRMQLTRPRLLQGLLGCSVIIGGGIAAAPRFDYRPAEEFAWSEAVRGLDLHEKGVVERYEGMAEQYRGNPTAARPGFATFLEQEFIPLYQDMTRQLEKMHFTAERRTERRRIGLLRFAEARAAAGQKLQLGLEAGDPSALESYERSDGQAVAALKKAIAE
jgi:rhomboid protease GluP